MTEEQYIKFLTDVYVKADGSHLNSASIGKYSRQTTSKIDSYLNTIMPGCDYKTIYEVQTIEELKEIERLLKLNSDFVRDNKEGHQMYSAGLHRYIEFAEGTLINKYTSDASVLDIKEPVPRQIISKQRTSVIRDTVKIAQAKGLCNHHCQIDESHITFRTASTGKNYVEGHHIIPLSCQNEFEYSLDVLANIIVLCPNCHRKLHYSVREERLDDLYRIYDSRYERFDNAGILTDRSTFVDMATENIIRTNNNG